MKNLLIISLISATAILSSCSKKNMSTAQNEKNAILSRQLEQSHYASNQSDNADVQGKSLAASASSEINYNQNLVDTRFENYKMANSKKMTTSSKSNKIKILSNSILNKVNPNQLEKLKIEVQNYASTKKGITSVNNAETTKKTQEVSIGQIITGIIVGAIGLVLIALAAAGIGAGVAGLIWTAGVIFFIAGVILVLVGMF